MKESNLLKKLEIEASKFGNRLFRNNVGKAWIGSDAVRFQETRTITVQAGDVWIKKARRFHGGLCKGSSDLIGWTEIEITEEMVGKTVAVFTAPEAKTGKQQLRPEQTSFVQTVEKAGGIAGKVTNSNDYHNLIESFRAKLKKLID